MCPSSKVTVRRRRSDDNLNSVGQACCRPVALSTALISRIAGSPLCANVSHNGPER